MFSKTVLKISLLFSFLLLAFAGTTTYLSLNDPKAQSIDKEKVLSELEKVIEEKKIDMGSITSSSSYSTSSSSEPVKEVEGVEDEFKTLTPDIGPTTSLQVEGYIADFAFKTGMTTFKKNVSKFKSISPVWYSFDINGTNYISKRNNTGNKELISLTKKNGVLLLPSISQFNFSDLSQMLKDESSRVRHADEIVKIVKTNGYDGIDLDYENIAEGDKENFEKFILTLSSKMKKSGKIFAFTVLAKDFSSENSTPTRKAQDWKFLGENTDLVRIMVYDYQNPSKGVFNISPASFIENVTRYAQTKIPNEKISIGLPLYAYSYSGETKTALTYKDIQNIKTKNTVLSDELDPISKEKMLTYEFKGKTYSAYYTDSEVDIERRNLLMNMGINKIFYWRLGDEDQRVFE